ncbi:MAG: Maf family protein [Proteobacteria bacterium]|nr:Maf family protein [Pseudomonadota bacterium]MDA1285239.1 Maf family protein [Pseudomonadota bacterium]
MTAVIILASASEARRKLLEQSNVPFTTQTAELDENTPKRTLLAEGKKPKEIAIALAELKVLSVTAKNPTAWVIGADQVVDFDGELLSKPNSMSEAREQLLSLRGQTHKLFSAAVIAHNGKVIWRHTGEVRLTMRDFSDIYLEGYLARIGTDALATVGSYKLEEEGVRLFSQIQGDYFSVLGLPLLEILNFLTETGILVK